MLVVAESTVAVNLYKWYTNHIEQKGYKTNSFFILICVLSVKLDIHSCYIHPCLVETKTKASFKTVERGRNRIPLTHIFINMEKELLIYNSACHK